MHLFYPHAIPALLLFIASAVFSSAATKHNDGDTTKCSIISPKKHHTPGGKLLNHTKEIRNYALGSVNGVYNKKNFALVLQEVRYVEEKKEKSLSGGDFLIVVSTIPKLINAGLFSVSAIVLSTNKILMLERIVGVGKSDNDNKLGTKTEQQQDAEQGMGGRQRTTRRTTHQSTKAAVKGTKKTTADSE